MRCAEMREVLPAYARDGDPALAARRHLSHCPECSAELERYRTLMASLATLESAPAEPPVGLKASLVAIPSQARRLEGVRTHVNRNRRKYAGGLAVAVAGATATALWAARRQRALAA